ncbi:MAG: DUF2207 domain-containing protein [Oscillospiraceae bacterium]|nr:DUF2207 domain-containing protein [Oscillospiraceae bacterium]
MRRFLIVMLCAILLAALAGSVSAAENRIAALTQEITVDADGAAYVKVTAVVEFVSAPETFLFPLNSNAGSVNASGGEYSSTSVNGVKCIRFSNSNGFIGTQTFVCTYSLPRDAREVDGGQQFHIDLIEQGWDYPIDELSVTATFPAPVTLQPTWSSSYYGDVIDNFLEIELKENDLVVSSAAPLKDHETLEMFLNFESGAFTLRHLPGKTTSFNQIAFYVLVAAALLYWFFFLREKPILPVAQQTAAMETTAGELPCQLYGELPDMAATLAHWGNLGYIAIHRNARGRIILKKRLDMGNERKPAEQKLFAAIFRAGPVCDLQGQRFRSVSNSASALLRSAWLRRIFTKKPGSPYLLRAILLFAGFFVCLSVFDVILPAAGIRWLFLPILAVAGTVLCYLVQQGTDSVTRRNRRMRLFVGGASALLLLLISSAAGALRLMLLTLLLQILCVLVTHLGGRHSDMGRELVRQDLGLRRYLRKLDSESVRRLNALDGQFFYRMLPFAEVMGVGGVFTKRFGQWRPEPCIWLTDANRRPDSAEEFYALYLEIAAAIRSEEWPQLLGLPDVFSPARRTPVRRTDDIRSTDRTRRPIRR